MRILVTGGAGFIGANLCRLVVERYPFASVAVIDDLSTGRLGNLEGLPIEVRTASILDYPILREMARTVDVIIHLAARGSVQRSIADPQATHLVNATGTLNVLEVAREFGSYVVLASSSSVLGMRATAGDVGPRSPYAASKAALEAYAAAYAISYGMKVATLRFFNVFGPYQSFGHDYAAFIPKAIEAKLSDLEFTVFGDGLQSRDFTYVRDVCEVVCAAMDQRLECAQNPVEVGFGRPTTVIEILNNLGTSFGAPIPYCHGPMRAGDIRHSRAEAARLRSLFPGLESTPLTDALHTTVGWYRHNVPDRQPIEMVG